MGRGRPVDIARLGHYHGQAFDRKDRLDELETHNVAETCINVCLIAGALRLVVRVELDDEIVAILCRILEPVAILGIHHQIVFDLAIFDRIFMGLDHILLLDTVGRGYWCTLAFDLLEIWHAERGRCRPFG